MAAAEFGALLLADFDHRLDLENARRLRPSPHPFGALNPGPFGGGPLSVIPAHARTRDLPAPSHFMLHAMNGGAGSDPTSEIEQQASTSAMPAAAPATAVPGAPDFRPASAAITPQHRAAFAESSTMAQKRRLLEDSAGLECSFMGVETGTGPWDAGSEETARRVATLQARLQQRLGPEYVSTRAGPSGGPKVSYIEGWKAIDLANDVFGFNGWSSSIVSIDVDYLEENPETGRVNVGVSVTIRITLRDGTFHEDVGYGSMDNSKSRAAALEKSKKEAVTDALKRTLRTFGRVLGNCLYDKQFLRDVSKVSLPPVKFDPSTLHRRPEFAQGAGKKPTTTSEQAEPTTTNPASETGSTMPPPPIPAPALTRTATAPAPRSSTTVASAGPPVQTSAPTSSKPAQAPAPNPALARSRTMGPGSVSTNTGTSSATGPVSASRAAGSSAVKGNTSTSSANGGPAAQAMSRDSSSSGQGTGAGGDGVGASTMTAAQKARLAEQRRMEAQKRLARTKSMHANVSTTTGTTPDTSFNTTVAPSPTKSGPQRIEAPSFGPQIVRAVSAKTEPEKKHSPQISTPFGPRFTKSKYADDSGVFFPAGDEDESMESLNEGNGGGSGITKKRMLVDDRDEESAGGMGVDRSIRAPSVGRFTGLTPNSAQLLRSGTTSLSAAAGGPTSGNVGGPASGEVPGARKHSLCGPLQPRRPTNNTTGATHHAAAAGASTEVGNSTGSSSVTSGGIENLGLAERVSGVGVGVGKVRGVAVAGGGTGSGAGFVPASAASAGRWAAGTGTGTGLAGTKRPVEGSAVNGDFSSDPAKRVRR
ncbi:hypothetical protein CF319_g417 [Tilletia indica]|nr:hypothetical protein CF319_g417 [Tilletia indica]